MSNNITFLNTINLSTAHSTVSRDALDLPPAVGDKRCNSAIAADITLSQPLNKQKIILTIGDYNLN